MGSWLRSSPGRYLWQWEQQCLDLAVADVFGFHALQLGLPEFDGLRANRMPHRWLASPSLGVAQASAPADARWAAQPARKPVALHCEFDALPFPNASIDLVVLPHTLELARDPHHTLREVERVLVPDGRVVIVGFNPVSLWGLRHRAGRVRRQLGLGGGSNLYLPQAGEFIGYWRLRDWLRLLGFEVEAGRFGCWRPPLLGDPWLARFAWLDAVGEHWWPVLGAAYFVQAVKRVRGMRLVGLVRKERHKAAAAPAVVANRRRETVEMER